MIKNFRLAAIVSSILMLPFMMLEFWFNETNSRSAIDHIVLFGLMWLLPTIFIAVLLPAARTIRAGNINPHALSLFLRMACLGVIAVLWGSLLIDQLPCFLGVPNCD